MRPIFRTVVAGSATAALTVVGLASPALASHDGYTAASGRPGDETIVVPINDSEAGGTYYQPFERAYDGETPDGTPVFVYVPVGALTGVTGVHSLDPMFDHNTADKFVPCAEQDPEDYRLTLDQITYLGDQLSDQIVRVDEEHFGPMDAAVLNDPSSDSLVTLVYNVQDENYYDCAVDTYTAGYFAPEFMTSMGMNVITLDAFDWANRVGSPGDPVWTDDGDTTNDRPELYEGVIAHELEHLLMNYSDSGELSWVDEGLADMAAFLNGYDMTGSHLTYQQVFHRETSLTRWGGGLENYGASFSYFAYLWEQAGGNGDGMTPDQEYGPVAGDLLIKLIFENQADGMEGVQAAIDAYNADDSTTTVLRSAEDLFRDWAVAMYVDDEGSTTFDLQNFNLGTDSGGWTIDVANDEFWDNRGNYSGNQPEAKWSRSKNRPAGTALPFGVSYEKFSNPGRYVSLEFDGANTTSVRAPDGSTHFWGGYTSQSETILEANGLPTGDLGGQTLTFANWHFIEDGWDYGFVEALVGGVWQT
ncbi:MAG TPA: hypothetical protein VFF24_11460, partial [Acidimicrobiia bacterium]|nr:hypothetical protein [Acidimicrobiia bacterium]